MSLTYSILLSPKPSKEIEVVLLAIFRSYILLAMVPLLSSSERREATYSSCSRL
eukprot:CAMPEP_0182473640 /NCGR_PEP_ID=MMETSP1319-20130603/24289_1 /TAXON_ID=172717 /ORGANISM="Bolidomonas pacifica, Strain RCC208" /LENGTH=53 /DNA_ID=CAMNT_0024674463 /DNA_START=52 /DNA_END=209 /DNA_ORIENTATION=-